jgi:uncharacterized Tic20 family protein
LNLKRTFSFAFVVTGLLIAAVSCTPIVQISISAAAGTPIESQTSFLGAAMLLAFACLCTVIGVLIYARPVLEGAPAQADTPGGRVAVTLVTLSPLMMFTALPMVHLLIPLWVARRSLGVKPALSNEAKRVLNFQITWTLFAVVGLLLCLVLVGVFLLAALLVLQLAVTLLAAWRVWHGERAVYPMSITFIH